MTLLIEKGRVNQRPSFSYLLYRDLNQTTLGGDFKIYFAGQFFLNLLRDLE